MIFLLLYCIVVMIITFIMVLSIDEDTKGRVAAGIMYIPVLIYLILSLMQYLQR